MRVPVGSSAVHPDLAERVIVLSSAELLSSLHQRGVRLWVNNGELRFQAPRGVLSPVDLDGLRAHRKEIIELMNEVEASRDIPLQPRATGCPAPLTALQVRWRKWITQENGGLSQRICTAMRVSGLLRVDLLRTSLEVVFRRHESLRTRIVLIDGVLAQIVDASCDLKLDVIDLSEVSPSTAESRVLRCSEEFSREKIDLSVGPLFAAKLFKLSVSEHVLILALDHMITDGVSNNIVCREIWTAYHQLVRGLAPSLPQLPVQFADYAVWQQRTYGAWLRRHELYWRRRLAGAPKIQIPIEDRLIEVKNPVGATLEIPFGDALSARLRIVARREGVLLPVVVLTIYLAAMSHWCNQRDLVLTFLSNARYRPELQGMVGFLANVLYLRVEVTDDDSLSTLLKRVNFEFHSAYEHQDFGWVPDLVPECSTELHFNWLPPNWISTLIDDAQEGHGALRIQPFPLSLTWPFKFIPWFSDSPAGVTVLVGYRPDIFERTTVERFGKSLVLFAEQLSGRPSARVLSLRSSMFMADA